MQKDRILLSKTCPMCNFVQTVYFAKCHKPIRWHRTEGWCCFKEDDKIHKKHSGSKKNTRCHQCDHEWKWEIPRSLYHNIGVSFVTLSHAQLVQTQK